MREIVAQKYPIELANDEFTSFLSSVLPHIPPNSKFGSLRATWLGLLCFLQPIVTGERVFSAEENAIALRFQREQTGIMDELATQRAMYFGVMSLTVFRFNKERHRYAVLDLDELGQRWLSQAFTPMESLIGYGDSFEGIRPQIEMLAKNFVTRYVEPKLTDKSKLDDAFGWFITQFLSGVLLAWIMDMLTLRDYFDQEQLRGKKAH